MQRLGASGLATGKKTAAPCESMTRKSISKAWKAPGRLPVAVVKAQGGGSNGSSSSSNDNNGLGSSSATLAAHRTWLRRQRVLHSEPHPSDGDIIELNVAGCIMLASRNTLRQVPGSLLSLLFDPDNSAYLVSDTAGRIFFDYDPAAFALVLRYLRELRVTGGCASAVLLPPIPPIDAGPFRSLVAHLGLQIDEAAITAATARGAAIAAAGGSSSSSTNDSSSASSPGGFYRPSASPYASRPAAGSTNGNNHCAQSHQQQWWQKQQQQHRHQQQLVRPQPPEVPPSGITTASKSIRLSSPSSNTSRSSSSSGGHNRPSDSAAGAVGGPGRNSAKQQQQAYAQLADPVVQYFYIRTSKVQQQAGGSAGGAELPAAPPLHVAVLAENDIMAQQSSSSSSSKGWSNSISGFYSSHVNRGSNGGPAPGWGLLSGFDAFCSTSSSKHLMVFSMVTRGSAGVDNVFVGVTSSNHTDQRGLQIPSFGWRQMDAYAAECSAAGSHGSAVTWDMETLDNCSLGSKTLEHVDRSTGLGSATSDSANGRGETLDNRSMLWQCGDLVQLMVELGITNKLILKVNGYEVKGCYLHLPTFRQWCWYVAFFRGTEVVSVVFEQGSVSMYAGDHVLKRYLV